METLRSTGVPGDAPGLGHNLACAGVFGKVRATMRAITVKFTFVRAGPKCIVQSSRKVYFPSLSSE